MKAIQLKSITLRNWRGEKERTTQFHTDGTVTRICGRNGLGKSRHMDAFCWLLYAPMFIDRAESVNTFIASNAQMIFLQVTTDSQLTVK